MKHLFCAIVAILAMTSCSRQTEYDEAARQLGEKHAREIVETHMTERELISRLLDVRAREYQISQKVNETAAKRYIESFTSYIKQNSDSLAALIFNCDSIADDTEG